MSNTHDRLAEHQHSRHRTWILSIVAAVLLVGASVAAIAAATSGGSPSASYRKTGELSSMGMPVLETPGTSSGTVETANISAAPASFALGRVPLDVAVRPTWLLRNTGTGSVTIGDPHVQINQGCCPGAFTLQGPSSLDPGGETNLSFELSMHPGMDGPHDMTIHVPVQHADGSTETVALSIIGDFRG
ncbi:MAG: hypothetical protein ABI706_10485 [Ilumatobacteraceae bacterium]